MRHGRRYGQALVSAIDLGVGCAMMGQVFATDLREEYVLVAVTGSVPDCPPRLSYSLEDGQLTLLTERRETLVYVAVDAVPDPAPTLPAEVGMPPLASLHMVDEQNGWAKGLGPLLHTTDGGKS